MAPTLPRIRPAKVTAQTPFDVAPPTPLRFWYSPAEASAQPNTRSPAPGPTAAAAFSKRATHCKWEGTSQLQCPPQRPNGTPLRRCYHATPRAPPPLAPLWRMRIVVRPQTARGTSTAPRATASSLLRAPLLSCAPPLKCREPHPQRRIPPRRQDGPTCPRRPASPPSSPPAAPRPG